MEFHERLQLLMAEQKMTQSVVARKLKRNRSSVSSWFYGRTQPKSEVVHRLALIFNVSEAWLIGVKDAPRDRTEYISPEVAELVRLFKLLNIKNKTRLLAFAYDLEEEENGKL